MKTAAAALFLLLSSAEAFNTSPLNVRSPVAQSDTRLAGYLGQLEQLSSDGGKENGVKKNGLNGTPVNGAKQISNGATQVSNGVNVANISNGGKSNGTSQIADPVANSSAELLQMQVALAEAEARLAALKSELPSHKEAVKKVSINLKMPSIAIPQTQMKESAKKVVFAAAVAKDEPTVAAAPPVVASLSKSFVAAAVKKHAKAAAKPVIKAFKPFTKAAAKPVVKAVKNATNKVTTSKVAPKPNGDYLSSLAANSIKLKSTPQANAGYLDSITQKSLAARVKSILGYKTTANLDPSSVLAYQFLRNVAGCVSISIGWFVTSQKYGLSPLAPGLWKPTTVISVASFLLVNLLRPARVILSTKISTFWSGMLDLLQRQFKISKPSARRVALAANVVVSAALLTGGIVLASQYSGVAIDKLAREPVGRAAKMAARAATKFAR